MTLTQALCRVSALSAAVLLTVSMSAKPVHAVDGSKVTQLADNSTTNKADKTKSAKHKTSKSKKPTETTSQTDMSRYPQSAVQPGQGY